MKRRGSRMCAAGRIGGVVLAAMFAFCAPAAQADLLARGDSAWARRAEGEREGRPLSGPIREAVHFYESELSARPESREVRWKLLRAIHFAGDFAAAGEEESRGLFDRAREVSDAGLALLADEFGSRVRLEEMDPEEVGGLLAAADVSPRDVARLYFWSAINWGAWSQKAGLLSAVKQGVANRIHRYTLMTLALEPDYDEGGALRLLGRLHAELPRVPFVSGWVDREASIPLLEQAYAMAPANPGNRLLLALTLLDLAPARRSEALALLEQLEGLTPRPPMLVEDLAMRKTARERLGTARMEST